MSTSSAMKEGINLLQKFRDGKSNIKSQDLNSSSSFIDLDDDGYYEAVADGSRLAMAYSETKRKVSRSFMSTIEDNEDIANDVSPLEIIRIAMLKLNTINNDDKENINNISAMLQGVEEYLEKLTSSRSRVNARLAYSSEKRSRTDFFEEDSTSLENEPSTPTALNLSGQSKQRSVFMENQLDLNESEMEYYEGVINDLADKLEKVQEEKEDLLDVSKALGEKLQRLGQQKEESLLKAQQHLDEVRSQFQVKLDVLRSDLDQSKEINIRERHHISDLEGRLEQESVTVGRLRDCVLNLENKLLLETTVSNQLSGSAQRIEKSDDCDETEAELRVQIEDLQMELEDNRSEIDHLVSIIEDLRGKIDTSHTETKSIDSDEIGRLRASVASLQLLLVNCEREKLVLIDEQAALKITAVSLSESNKELQEQLNGQKHEQLLFGGQSSPSSEKAVSPAKAAISDRSFADVSFRFDDTDPDKRILFTPTRNTSLNQSQINPRSLLKVYMDNQLDLNESEMQYYEGVVNGLAEQVEALQEERTELQRQYDSLVEANAASSDTMEALRSELSAKQGELDYVNNLFDALTARLEERDALIETLTAQVTVGVEGDGDLTNSFLGIDKDVTDNLDTSGNVYLSQQQVLDESFSQKSDVEELRRLLSHREQQVKVQISQLQSLQDALSEQKSANNTLRQQKAGFKKAVEAARSDAQSKAEQELAALMRVRELEIHMETVTRHSSSLERTVENLQVQAGEFRLQIEQQHVRGVMETPNKTTRQQLLDESMSSQHNASFSSSVTPLKQRLNRTEAQVDDLNLQLRQAVKAREDTQLELEKTNIRFQTKTRQVEDLGRDLAALQEELDARLEELDRLKLQDMKVDAAHRLRQIDCESEIEQLRERVQLLEATIVDLNEALAGETADLLAERSANTNLRGLLDGLSERDDKMEELVAELRNEHEKLTEQLGASSQERQHKAALLARYESERDDLREQVQLLVEASEQKERDHDQRYRMLELEALNTHSNLSSLHVDSESYSQSLQQRLDEVLVEKEELLGATRVHKAAVQQLEQDLSTQNLKWIQSQRAVSDVAEIMHYYMARLLKLEESLESQVRLKVSSMSGRIQVVADALESVASNSSNSIRESSLSREMVEAALRDSQSALRKALDRHEEDAAEKDDLWRRYQEARHDLEIVSSDLSDARQQLDDRVRDVSRTLESIAVSPEEYGRLADRLSEAEQRAVQMSSEGAKAFARSAKNIAYLEGECGRLKTLVDHFRVVNVKLTGDLKSAHLEGAQSKSLEHRVKRAVQDEVLLRERVSSLEALLARKDKELLDGLKASRVQEERRAEKFDAELNRLGDLVQVSQDVVNTLKRENEDLRVTFADCEAALRREVEGSQDRLRLSEKESLTQSTKYQDVEFELRQLRSKMSEKDHQCSQAEIRSSLLQQELLVTKETQQTVTKDLVAEIQEKQSRIRLLESNMSALRMQVVDLESSFNQRDEEITQKLLRRANCDDENRELRAANESLSEEVSSLGVRNEELQYRINEMGRQHESLKETYSVLKNDTLRVISEKLRVSEESSGKALEQLERTQKELLAEKEELVSTRSSLTHTQNTLHRLQEEHLAVQTSDQVMRATNESLSEETEYLRREVEDFVDKLSASAQQVASMRSQLNDQAEVIAELEGLASDYETKLKNAKSMLISTDNSGAAIAAEIGAFCESMYVGGGASSLFSSSVSVSTTVHSSSTSTFSIGKDLFASPPLVVGRAAAPSGLYGHEQDAVSTVGSESLIQIRNSFDSLRAKSEQLVNNYNALHNTHERTRKEADELRKKHDKLTEKFQLVGFERDGLVAKLQHFEADLDAATHARLAAEHQRDILANVQESTSQRSSSILRDLDSTLLEALSKANDAAAGIVPIDTDALPNLSISQAIIRLDDPRHHAAGEAIVRKNDVGTVVSVLSASVGEVDRATAYLVGVINSLVGEHRARKAAAEKSETSLESKERQWAKERASHADQVADLQHEVETVHHKCSQAVVEAEAVRLELERLKHQLSDLSRNNGELEGEFKAASEVNNELRGALNDAETLCMELRSRMRVLQSELDKKMDDWSSASEQLEVLRRRVSDGELVHEKTSALLGRVRAEKEALDNVRRSLESELERSRSEVISLRKQTKEQDDGNRTAFEVEKLLAALSTTLDQLLPVVAIESDKMDVSSTGSPVNSVTVVRASDAFKFTSPSFRPHEVTDTKEDSAQSLGDRVDDVVKRLSHLRSLSRDEARSRRVLQNQHDALAQDFSAAQKNTEEVHRQLKRALSSAGDRESELREKVRENADAQQEIQRLKEEVSHLKKESSSLGESLEAERRGQHKQLTDLQSRDSDLAKLQREVESREHTINKLHEQVASTMEQLREAQAESSLRVEQLRGAKANSDRVLSTIEQLERSAENDKRERINCERKLLEAENTNTTVSRLKTRVHELESSLSVAYEESRSLSHAKAAADDQHQRHLQELEGSKKRVQLLENRIESILQEKNTFVDEISDTRRKIAAAKELAEEERQKRIRSEASVDALRRVGDEKRFYVDEFSAKAQEIESRQLQAEEEKRSLRIKINELKSVCEEKDSAFVAEATDRLKLEKDIKQLKVALQKRSQELSNSASYSSMLRSEGRNARKQVLEAVGQIREMVNIVRIDAHSVGVEIRSPEAKARSPAARGGSSQGGSGGAEFDEESLSLGLSEALGINDLSGSLDALRSAIAFVRSAPKNRIEVETASRRLEAECASLRKELNASEAKKNELTSQYKHELHTMQLQITEVRRTDSKNPHLVHQIAVLESSLKQERERRERLASDNEQLRAKIEHQSHDQHMVHSKSVKGSHQEMDVLRSEMQRQKAEYAQLTHELDAVTHHRTVLRDTVEQMDKQLRLKIDEVAAMRFPSDSHSMDGSAGGPADEETLRRQVQRFKARAAAVDELATTYRVSVLALYADGASYGAAQFGWQAHGLPQEFNSRGVHLIGVGWIEREINTVRHSYEDEVRLLDAEVGELRAKLKQNHSYIAELRRRFEDSMKAIFRTGKGQSQDGGMQQFDQLRLALEASDAEIHSLQQELGSEKTRGRHRHVQLVEDLTRTLQARDAALSALHRLEKFCLEQGLDIKGLAIYETLKSELVSTENAATSGNVSRSSLGNADRQQKRTINTLMRGLVESDHELAETERRESRRHRETHHSRSSSQGIASRNSHLDGEFTERERAHHTTRSEVGSAHSSSSYGRGGSSPPIKQSLSLHTRSSPPREGGSDAMEARLTESFLTNKSSQQQQGHAAGPSRVLFPTTDRNLSSTTRSVANRHEEYNLHSSTTNTSYQLHTVGHNAGSGSLRVTKANSSSSSNF